jgi:hypothetical protein
VHRETVGELQQQRRLPHTGFAPHEKYRTGHDTVADDPIELLDPGTSSRLIRNRNLT